MREFLSRLAVALSGRLHSQAVPKAMKIGKAFGVVTLLFLGISAISGLWGKTEAASQLSTASDPLPDRSSLPADFQFIGMGRIRGGSDDTWLIGNMPIWVDDHTQLGMDVRPGAFVSLSGRTLQDKVWIADRIELAPKGESFFTFNGELDGISTDTWLVGGYSLLVNEQTIIGEKLQVNDLVLASIAVLKNGQWLALEIKAFQQFPLEPTPIPTPTQIQAPVPTKAIVAAPEASENHNDGRQDPQKGHEDKERKEEEGGENRGEEEHQDEHREEDGGEHGEEEGGD